MPLQQLPDNIIYRSRAPLRVSFGGGGTEISPYLEQHGGVILNATINRYAYVSIRHCPSNNIVLSATDCGIKETLPLAAQLPLGNSNNGGGDDVQLPLHRAVYNRVVKDYNNGVPIPISVQTYCNAPVGSGLGTSSTLTAAMLQCWAEVLSLSFSEYELSALAHNIERVDLGLSGGYQDHYSAIFGGFNFMEFRADGEVVINPLRIRPAIISELEYAILQCWTGVSRVSATIIDSQKTHMQEAAAMERMHKIKASAYAMKDALLTGKIRDFAAILHDSWLLKRQMSDVVSTNEIDSLYETARTHGALGGKISGAGGGGYLLLIVEPHTRNDVISALQAQGKSCEECTFSRHGARAWQVSQNRVQGKS